MAQEKGVALDFKAARKTVKVKPCEQGALLLEVGEQLYHYTVCHFGAKFSAYRLSRLGAMLTCIAHSLLGDKPRRMWLYVDDLLALLRIADCAQPIRILLAFLSRIKAPVSWKKAQLSHSITWCGWSFHFGLETLHLTQPKLQKLREQLQALHRSKKVPRKLLEALDDSARVGKQPPGLWLPFRRDHRSKCKAKQTFQKSFPHRREFGSA